MAAEKGMFVKFMSAFKKHIKTQYPFVKQLEKSLDVSIPKSSSFYLGISPRYNKHVILKFLHLSKPWRGCPLFCVNGVLVLRHSILELDIKAV
jgi:hypothetical protein